MLHLVLWVLNIKVLGMYTHTYIFIHINMDDICEYTPTRFLQGTGSVIVGAG